MSDPLRDAAPVVGSPRLQQEAGKSPQHSVQTLSHIGPRGLIIREADWSDHDWVVDTMREALEPYYGGDHGAHAERIFGTHMGGGLDRLGYFSFEQRMFIAEVGEERLGMIHVVGKRQQTFKISPLIVRPEARDRGVGRCLLEYAESYALHNRARQMYCTVAEQNNRATKFFVVNGYTLAGRSDSHYKYGVTEAMLYKVFPPTEYAEQIDRINISVVPCQDRHEQQVRELLLSQLPPSFMGIDHDWVNSLFAGYHRRATGDVNAKYKLIYVAVDRDDRVLGVAAATPKKGSPIKLMPFVAETYPAFYALLTDLPHQLIEYGHKLYVHINPDVQQVVALQQRGWELDAAMPGAYREEIVTYQWSLEVAREKTQRRMRVKDQFLEHIIAGRKTLEVRVGFDNIRSISAGEAITLCSRSTEVKALVVDVRIYTTFEEMLRSESADRIVPGMAQDKVLRLLKEIYPPHREQLGVYVLDVRRASG